MNNDDTHTPRSLQTYPQLDSLAPEALVLQLQKMRDDRKDEVHDCYNTGDEDAMFAETELVIALDTAINRIADTFSIDLTKLEDR